MLFWLSLVWPFILPFSGRNDSYTGFVHRHRTKPLVDRGGSLMPGPFPPQINWQPVESLPLIGAMVDGLLDEAERQYVNLMSCRSRPHVLDNYTVDRVLKVYSDQAEDVDLYEE